MYRLARTWAQHPRAQGDPSSSVLRDCLEPLRRRAHDLQDGVAVHRRGDLSSSERQRVERRERGGPRGDLLSRSIPPGGPDQGPEADRSLFPRAAARTAAPSGARHFRVVRGALLSARRSRDAAPGCSPLWRSKKRLEWAGQGHFKRSCEATSRRAPPATRRSANARTVSSQRRKSRFS
jgi:hypothetical protein